MRNRTALSQLWRNRAAPKSDGSEKHARRHGKNIDGKDRGPLQLEIGALRASNAGVFVLNAGNLRGREIAAVLLAALLRMYRILYSRPGPFVARVSQSGHVTISGHLTTTCAPMRPLRACVRIGILGYVNESIALLIPHENGDRPFCKNCDEGIDWRSIDNTSYPARKHILDELLNTTLPYSTGRAQGGSWNGLTSSQMWTA